MLILMRMTRMFFFILLTGVMAIAQTPAKEETYSGDRRGRGFQHDSVPDAMGTVWKLGMDSDLWITYMRTDTGLITKAKPDGECEEPGYFDLLVFASTTGGNGFDRCAEERHDVVRS